MRVRSDIRLFIPAAIVAFSFFRRLRSRAGARRRRHPPGNGQRHDRRRHGVGQRQPEQPRLRVSPGFNDRRGRAIQLQERAAQSLSPRDHRAGIPIDREGRRGPFLGAARADVDHGAGRARPPRSKSWGTARTCSSTIRRPTSTSIRAASRRMPLESSSGLNQVITLASPGVVADANGFFHPIGDHAQTQFSIDNQPVTDQQSRIYSNQISPDAVQSMEVITGVPPAEFGDKDSLVVRIVTKSGLDQPKPTGSACRRLRLVQQPARGTSMSASAASVSATSCRSSAHALATGILDPPEFAALHGDGHSLTLFDRLDAASERPRRVSPERPVRPIPPSTCPNTYDQQALGQASTRRSRTFNVAPGYSRILGSTLRADGQRLRPARPGARTRRARIRLRTRPARWPGPAA